MPRRPQRPRRPDHRGSTGRPAGRSRRGAPRPPRAGLSSGPSVRPGLPRLAGPRRSRRRARRSRRRPGRAHPSIRDPSSPGLSDAGGCATRSRRIRGWSAARPVEDEARVLSTPRSPASGSRRPDRSTGRGGRCRSATAASPRSRCRPRDRSIVKWVGHGEMPRIGMHGASRRHRCRRRAVRLTTSIVCPSGRVHRDQSRAGSRAGSRRVGQSSRDGGGGSDGHDRARRDGRRSRHDRCREVRPHGELERGEVAGRPDLPARRRLADPERHDVVAGVARGRRSGWG